MATFFSRIVRFVKGIFTSTPAAVSPSDWRPATKRELVRLGFSPTSRRYVPRGVKRVSKSTKTISVRSYQQAQQQRTLEKRAELYRTGQIPRKYTRTRPHNLVAHGKKIKGTYVYEEIPWENVPDYFERAEKYTHMQVKVLGKTKEDGGKYKDQGTGPAWRTIYIDGAELEELYEQVNSDRGYAGFSSANQPIMATITFWKHRR